MEYKNAPVRHLAWCLFSQPMAIVPTVPAFHIKPSQELLDWLDQLDQYPSPLQDYLESHNCVLLGSYFECLWQFFFRFAPGWQLLDHHIQVSQDKQTLGELDILARNITHNQDFHIELAVKFFLRQPNTKGPYLEHWLGPQSRDRLDLKLNKLANKQLPFLHHSVTQAELHTRGLPCEPQQALVLKGYLFEPWQDKPSSLHSSINAQVTRSNWLYQHQVSQLKPTNVNWVVLPKHDWLGSYYHNNATRSLTLLDHKTMVQYVEHHFSHNYDSQPYTLMLAALSDISGELLEQERFMVVHNNWPNEATKHK